MREGRKGRRSKLLKGNRKSGANNKSKNQGKDRDAADSHELVTRNQVARILHRQSMCTSHYSLRYTVARPQPREGPISTRRVYHVN